VVPVITTQDPGASHEFYRQLLGFDLAMDMGWISSLVSPTNPTAQIAVVTQDATAPVQPQLTIEVGDIDAVHAEALRRGDEIVHPLTDEPWGARRFFVRDPNGLVVNVVGSLD
jgi:catechol 2,3-dioxygenase-like lactoylglutathione lyase family enzyme